MSNEAEKGGESQTISGYFLIREYIYSLIRGNILGTNLGSMHLKLKEGTVSWGLDLLTSGMCPWWIIDDLSCHKEPSWLSGPRMCPGVLRAC